MTATNSPGWIVTDTPSSARLPWKRLVTPSRLITGEMAEVMCRRPYRGLLPLRDAFVKVARSAARATAGDAKNVSPVVVNRT